MSELLKLTIFATPHQWADLSAWSAEGYAAGGKHKKWQHLQ